MQALAWVALLAVPALALAEGTCSEDHPPCPPAPPGSSAPARAPNAAWAPRYLKSMDMNMAEPMTTGMARKGMKKGDVKKHAEKKMERMEEMMHTGE
jgi:hypothetical protein